MIEENKIRDAADAIKGVVEAVPVYQDVVQPAAREVGTALQTVAKTLHILLAPVSGLVWGYDQIKDFVGQKVAEKLADVPEQQLRSPEPHVAGPALEALRYTGYQEGLREMYANLLATSIDAATVTNAHPSFVEIIRQMSPDEALMIKSLAQIGIRPKIDVRSENKQSKTGNWKNTELHPDSSGGWLQRTFSWSQLPGQSSTPRVGRASRDLPTSTRRPNRPVQASPGCARDSTHEGAN